MTEIEAPVEIELTADEVEVTGNIVDAYTIPKEDIEVQAIKSEYTVVGDKLYSSIEASEAPEWLTGIIDTVVGSIVNTKLAELDTAISSITTAIQEIEAVKNQYQELITIAANPDDITISRLETLDSTVANNSAQIVNLDTTKTSEAEAVAISANALDTSIDNGRISSLVTNLNTSISNLDQALSTSITALTSTLGSNYSTITNVLSTSAGEFSTEVNAITELDTRLHDPVTGEITGSAGVVQTIAADLQTLEKGAVAANAQDITDIHAYVRTDGTNYGGATSTLGQEIASEVENGEHRTQAKFLYGSNITLPNGQVYTTGFGMTSEAVGNEANSEFWINAEKFKFTNTAQSGQVAPFTIDASGTTPQVTFNGVVNFSNTDMSAYDNSNIDTSSLALKDMSNVTTIDGGKITTGSITADRLAPSTGSSTTWTGGGLVSEDFNGNPYGDIGSPTSGFRLSSNSSNTADDPSIYGAYIKGSTIETTNYQMVTDYGEYTAPILIREAERVVTTTSSREYYGIYSPSDTSSNVYKVLHDSNNNNMVFISGSSVSHQTSNSGTCTIYIGDTVVASVTLPYPGTNSNTTVTVYGGITVYVSAVSWNTDITTSYLINKRSIPLPDFSGLTGEFSIELSCSSTTIAVSDNPSVIAHSNL